MKGPHASVTGVDDEELEAAPGVPVSHPSFIRPGETIEFGGVAGRCEIVRSLGRGGMAEVFLARRVGPAGFVREVALKCIIAEYDGNERFRRDFLHEARLASRLHHPNIAQAYDLAERDGRYYLVLEYIDGVTVKDVVRAAKRRCKQLSEGFCCEVIASVAEGLHYAHSLRGDDGQPLGIVHRDLSASNVMIARSGGVKLLDFGVALARMQGRERTQTGVRKGTFAYASPELLSDEPVDGRSDLFGLGILLVELLTGVRAFDAASEVGTIRKIDDCKPEQVKELTRGLHRELVDICVRALARRPADRFQAGAEFSKALRGYLAREAETCSPSDCVAELAALGVLGNAAADPRESSAPELTVEAVTAVDETTAESRHERAKPGRQRAWGRWIAAAAAIAAVLLVTFGAARRRAASRDHAAPARPAAVPALAPSAPNVGQVDTGTRALPTVATPPFAVDQIVRPKRRAGKEARNRPIREKVLAAVEQGPRQPSRGAAEFLDHPSVESDSATLARGTLVPAKLARAIGVDRSGEAEAVVTEDVMSNGALLVPKGSTVACTSRSSRDGRVPVACDSIRTPDRLLSFKGVAVGEGQHVGLRALDSEVAAGTPFVVYVSASAAIR